MLLIRLGVACRDASSGEQGKTIGEIVDSTIASAAGTALDKSFADEMLVMDSLDSCQFHCLLDGLQRNHTTVALKAVVTEQNLTWTAAELHDALLEEHKRLSQNGM